MDLRTAKIIALFGQVLVLALFTLLPIKVTRAIESYGKKGELVLACLRCFGGGALIGSFMLDQMPEIRIILTGPLLDKYNISYPVPEVIAGAGFFLFLFIERFVHICNHRSEKKEKEKAMELARRKLMAVHSNPALSIAENGSAVTPVKELTLTVKPNGGTNVQDDRKASMISQGSLMMEEIDYDTLEMKPSATRSMILLIALSADGIFQGLTVGLKNNSTSMWNTFTAIVCHEFVLAFCLGMELMRSSTSVVKGVVLPAIFYALTPAIGTAIGIGLYEVQSGGENESIDLANGILQSISTGVFLYVAFIGILAEELTVNPGTVKLVCILIGFGLMAGLSAIPKVGPDAGKEGTTMSWETTTEDPWTMSI